VERVDVGGQALQHLRAAPAGKKGSLQGGEPAKQIDAQYGQETQRGVMRDEALGIAAPGARKGEEADARARSEEVERQANPGKPSKRGSRYEPSRQAEQRDPGQDGGGAGRYAGDEPASLCAPELARDVRHL